MSSAPDRSWPMVRSRCACTMSPLIAAAENPRARSFSASSSVACLVRTKMIIASNGFDLEDPGQRVELARVRDLHPPLA